MSYTDDPAADFARRDEEDAEWLESRPVCDFCGEAITDDYYYEIGEDIICKACLDDMYRKRVEDD